MWQVLDIASRILNAVGLKCVIKRPINVNLKLDFVTQILIVRDMNNAKVRDVFLWKAGAIQMRIVIHGNHAKTRQEPVFHVADSVQVTWNAILGKNAVMN